MEKIRTAGSVVVVALLAIAGGGCQPEEGPLERTGRVIDETAEESARAMQDAGERMSDSVGLASEEMDEAARQAEEGMEQAGEQMSDAAHSTEEGMKKAGEHVGEAMEHAGEELGHSAEEVK